MSVGRLVIDPFYYLNNFEFVMDRIADRYADLLRAPEREFMSTFRTLPRPSRALLVRMIMRKRALFRESHLTYPEIGDPAVAMSPLLHVNWVDDHPLIRVDDLFAMMAKSELSRRLKLPIVARSSKRALLERCRHLSTGARPIEDWCTGFTGRVYQVRVAELCERFRLMYFGNFRQNWSEFIVTELGLLTYEQVDCGPDSRPFQTSEQIDHFHSLYRCRQMLECGIDPHTILAAMPSPIQGSPWLETRRQRVKFRIGRAFERAGAIAAALQVYSTISHGDAVLRCIRLREKSDLDGALALCDAALAPDLNIRDAIPIRRARHRLRRRLGIAAADPALGQVAVPEFEVSIEKPSEPRAVEYLVRDALIDREQERSTVYYVENTLVSALFGLLCWRAIFAPIPGAFFHGFHREPVDLSDPGFYDRRASDFAECFSHLERGTYLDIIRDNYLQKRGIATSFVAWGSLSAGLLETALDCLPAQHLKIWFQWIAKDVSSNRSGFPDLIQFWPHESRYRLIEVKAPGDRLQESQRRCLALCASHQMPVAVCKVKWLPHPAARRL